MADPWETLTNNAQEEETNNSEDLHRILSVVVKRRKTIPTKCMEINKQVYTYDLLRLENARVITEENPGKEQFQCTSKKILQGLKELKSSMLTLDDIQEAEDKLKKFYEKAKQMNTYLEKRKKFLNNF